jgi:hypothetical protein
MAFNPGKDRNMIAALKRTMDAAWFSADVSNRAQPPAILNGEFLTAVNAAGTGTVNLLGLDGTNKVVFGDAALPGYASRRRVARCRPDSLEATVRARPRYRAGTAASCPRHSVSTRRPRSAQSLPP